MHGNLTKQNGDLKLAAIPPASAVILELTRVDRLFEIFATVSEAVDSFYGFSVPISSQRNRRAKGLRERMPVST